jgi:sugar lactone lactonase YvrE
MKKTIKSIFLSLAITGLCQFTKAQLPPIFEGKKEQLVKATNIAVFEKKTFMENLVRDAAGNLFATNLDEGELIKIKPSTKQHEVYAKIEGKLAGVTIYKTNEFLLTGWDATGKPTVFLVDKNKKVSTLLNVDGGMFLNGITRLNASHFLIADSYAGCIWVLDAASRKISLWLKDDLLARSSTDAKTPAVNGLKIHNGILYASNTEKQLLITIPIVNSKAGKPSVWLDKVNMDDFSFDAAGNIYAATHVYNIAIKISPTKKVTIIATQKEGMSGCTAVLVVPLKNKLVAYVTTNGGVYLPPPTGIEEGKVVELFLN